MDKLKENNNRKKCGTGKTIILFSVSAIIVATAVYKAVKEVERKRMENELLAYEVW